MFNRTLKSGSIVRRAAYRAAALVLFTLPLANVGAQSTTDSIPAPPKPLGAVVISATRTEQTLRSLPMHVTVVGPREITASAAQTVQDFLRTIPGFTTRDFQSGLVTGPGASIVSLRGLGGSSAGRTLVLLDGLPAGDPFSGWLDWGRIPLPMLESAEVVRGGGSTIWGSRSLGGVVNLKTISPQRDELRLMLERGSLSTMRGAGSGSLRRGNVSATLGADIWKTDGFLVLRADQAGPADRPAEAANRAISGKVTWDASQSLQLWGAGGMFEGGEPPFGSGDRQSFDEGRGGLRWLTSKGVATVAAFTNHRVANQESFSYNSDRSARTPQRAIETPARSTGVSLQWTQMAFERHELSAGADISSAKGSLAEQYSYSGGVFTREREVAGTQELAGVFLQDAADLGAGVRLLASVRADRIRNADGRRIVRDLSNGSVISDSLVGGLSTNSVTGSLGLRWQQSDWLALRSSVYEAFRAPSMYEMYQPRFSSRGTVTEANAELKAERLKGGEFGVDLTPGPGFITRVTVFTNRVTSPIMDITIGSAGSQPEVIAPCGLMPANQTCGQRRNVPALRSRGVETEIEWRPTAAWRTTAGYSFSPTRVYAPGQPVDGMQAIRSARHMVSSSLSYDSPRWASIAIDGRYVGARFDNDLNTVELADFYLVGLRLNRALGRGMTAYLKVENLLDEEFEIARSPSGQADMGAPRWVTAGLRVTW